MWVSENLLEILKTLNDILASLKYEENFFSKCIMCYKIFECKQPKALVFTEVI